MLMFEANRFCSLSRLTCWESTRNTTEAKVTPPSPPTDHHHLRHNLHPMGAIGALPRRDCSSPQWLETSYYQWTNTNSLVINPLSSWHVGACARCAWSQLHCVTGFANKGFKHSLRAVPMLSCWCPHTSEGRMHAPVSNSYGSGLVQSLGQRIGA
jgi:hypothetical protein